MKTAAERQAERASMVHLYRLYETTRHETLPDGSEVYIFTAPAVPDKPTKHFLLSFSGTAGRRSDHYSYRVLGDAHARADSFMRVRTGWSDRKMTARAERTGFKTSLVVGSVLVNSWGYDQTNIDYFQVVEVSDSGRSVTIRAIGARSQEDGFMQGTCWPLADHFIGAPIVKRVGPGDRVKIHSWGSWARVWTPGLNRWTAYA